MTFLGFGLSSLLTIGGGLAAAVTLLYILKLRRRAVPVPFARLWDSVLKDKQATSLFSQLKRLLSLLLQLALLALVLLALGDPRLSQNRESERNIVVLVDASASMKATDESPTRLGAAKTRLRDMVNGLGASDRMLIAKMDASVTPFSTMTDQVTELKKALDQIHASDTRADLKRGLEFALDALVDLPNAEILVVSDGAFNEDEEWLKTVPLGDTKLSYLKLGSSGRNLAITQFAVRRYPLDKSRYEVMLEVTNLNDTQEEVELTLLGDGQTVDVTQLTLKPNERLPRFYSDLAGASRRLEAVIAPKNKQQDRLPTDDHAYALMPERRRARVLVVTPGNTYLEAALLLDEYLDVELIEPSAYPPKQSFDVTVYDRVAPAHDPKTGAAFYLDPPAKGGPLERGRQLEMFGFDTWDKKSPVLRWMQLGDIQVASGSVFKPEKADQVLGASDHGPLLVSGTRAGSKFVALSFDPRASDFVLRVGWPLFVLNTVNYFVDEDTDYVSSFRTGEVWRIPAPSKLETATLIDPAKERRTVPVRDGRALYWGEEAGFYQLLPGAGAEPAHFAANMVNLSESTIKPGDSLKIQGKVAGPPGEFKAGVRRELWLYFVLGALGLSLIEWLTYHRRWTV